MDSDDDYPVEEGEDFNFESEELFPTLMRCAALNENRELKLHDYFSSLGFKLDAKDESGDDEPLQYAIRADNSKRGRVLPQKCLEEENNKDKSESRYHSILAKMVLEQDKGLLKEYDVFGNSGRSAIHLAALLSDLDMCKWLLNEGVDVRSLTKNEFEDSVLHFAAMNKSHGTELVHYFVSEHNFDLNTKDKLGLTPLHCALYMENIETAEELLKLSANLAVKRVANYDYNLENLMHFCVRLNKKKSSKFVHDKNRNLVNQLRGDGKTSLHIAAMRADLDMCKWLLDECGLDPHPFAGKQKLAVLDDAACNKSHGKEIIQYLVKRYSLDVNRKDEFGWTPLNQALYNENIDAAEELVRLGADLKVKNGPENLLQFSIRIDKVESVKFLFEKQPFLIAEVGISIVSIAKIYAGNEMKKFLVEKGFPL